MKNRLNRFLSVICAVMLMVCAVSAWAAAEKTPATPTDLAPEEDDGGAVDTLELIITKALRINEFWEGRMKKTKPAILKLDVQQAQDVHILVKGKDVWFTVEKSDQASEEPEKYETDPVTQQAIVDLKAEIGSYLITLWPVEPNLLAQAEVFVMDDETFTAWEADQTKDPIEAEPDTEPEEEEKNKPESKKKTERKIKVEVTWDVPEPVIGDTAHLKAKLTGYDELNYTMQWQYSPDQITWHDIPGETEANMDVVVTEENNHVWWRILVYVEEDRN